jgi:FAD/FMN-containing dehydrogenase
MDVGWMDEEELTARGRLRGRQGEIYRQLAEFRTRYADLIRERFPRLSRRVSGYNLDQLLPDESGRFNLARALVGTEGTCVTMLEATIQLVDYYEHRVQVVLGYEDIFRAGDHVPDVLDFEPIGVEGLDHILYDHVIDKHMPQQRYLNVLPKGKGWLVVELGSHDPAEVKERAARLLERVQATEAPPIDAKIVTDSTEQAHLTAVREAGLGATAFIPGMPDSWEGFEDSAVRPEQLGDYLRDLRKLFDKFGYKSSLYGHFGMGLVHCRLTFDLASAPGVRKYREFMEEAADLVAVKYRGSLSGEHGDGQSKAELLVKMFGPEIIQAFREFKAIWDPDWKMNPGRVVDPLPMTKNLRLGPNYDPW